MSLDLRLRAQRALQQRYRLDQEIGRGGMAVVYGAIDLASGHAVALKILMPSVATHLGITRFLREVAIAGSLLHRNILPIRDTGDADGLPFYVMPLVTGASLRQRLSAGAMPVDQALAVATQVADALGFAHTRQVVHRDIKPENLLLDGEIVLVTDFGIGKALNVAGSSSLTATGFVVGTPAYMSPEQAASDPELDGRSDLYSLGLVMYEMLAGALPFTGVTAQQVIASRFIDVPRPLREVRPEIAPEIAVIVHRLLAVHPADRFASADDLAAALRALPATPRS